MFMPTHKIVSRDGRLEQVLVHLDENGTGAYTKEEWEADARADWECDIDGEWAFKGCAIDEVEVSRYDAAAALSKVRKYLPGVNNAGLRRRLRAAILAGDGVGLLNHVALSSRSTQTEIERALNGE